MYYIPYNDIEKHLSIRCAVKVLSCSVVSEVKGQVCTVAPQRFHHDLHLCELVVVVLFGRGLARRLQVGLGQAFALRLLQSLAPLALRQIDSEDEIRSDESALETRRCAGQPAAHLKKWLFPHRIRSPCHR